MLKGGKTIVTTHLNLWSQTENWVLTTLFSVCFFDLIFINVIIIIISHKDIF